LAIAPAHRVARFVELLEGVNRLDGEETVGGDLQQSVRSLIAALEVKDPYTRGHSERVQIACEVIGELLSLGPRERIDLSWASLLHDVGKIGSPDGILKKPGKLTRAEYTVMQQHPLHGAGLLDPITWLGEARRGVRHHHERFDGQGYPDQLAGDQIPLISRAIAVADSFDAMTSRREYRGATGSDQAIGVLQKVAGTQLDPEIVRTFIEHLGRIQAALREAPTPAEGLFASPDVADEEQLRLRRAA
jgi:HD-GYP domain-containing protein (c-di-GMP phosphodiesterase class II)